MSILFGHYDTAFIRGSSSLSRESAASVRNAPLGEFVSV